MAAIALLRRLSVRDVFWLQELQENYPYAVIGVHRITVRPHRWCILHVKKGVFTKFLVHSEAFAEAVELQICVGLILRVLVYTGRKSDGRLTCRIVTYNTVTGGVANQRG